MGSGVWWSAKRMHGTFATSSQNKTGKHHQPGMTYKSSSQTAYKWDNASPHQCSAQAPKHHETL
eukprot:8604441-Ditylum_brightwellii.AAC.1